MPKLFVDVTGQKYGRLTTRFLGTGEGQNNEPQGN